MNISTVNNVLIDNTTNLEVKKSLLHNPVINKEIKIINVDSDKFKSGNEEVLSTVNKEQIKSNLQLEVTDNNGFAVMGKSDINAKVSGDITITPDFILGKLSGMKSNESKKFYPPKFDVERKQYIISGKAMEAILGTFNVGFEIRLGEVNGNLAFQVDSGIKRGSIYSDLEKMLKALRIETYKKDKLLFIKPNYKDVIDIPVSKDKTQKARIESLDTNSENTKVSIDKSGMLTVKLKDVKITASTDSKVVSNKSEKPDVAKVKFDFSLDNKLNPTINIKDGEVKTDLNQKTIEKFVGKVANEVLEPTLGTSLSISLSKLSGKVKIDENGLDTEIKTDIKIESNTDDSEVSGNLKLNLDDKKPVVEVNNLTSKLKDNQTVNADLIKYDSKNNSVKAQNIDSKLNQKGVNADVKGNIQVSLKENETQISFQGDTKGKVDKNDLKSDFETHGNHNIEIKNNKINVTIDQMMAIGSFNKSTHKKESTKSNKEINLTTNKVNVSGKANLGKMNLEGSLKEGGVKVKVGKDVNIQTSANVNAIATGKNVNGKVEVKGVAVDIKEDSNVTVKAENVKAEGSFKNKNKLSVDGKVSGNVDVNISNNGDIAVKATGGEFDAKFQKGEKIKVDGKGKDASFKINKNQDINIELKNVSAKTDLNLGNVKLSADTKGKKVNVDTKGDDVSIKTEKSTSYTDLKVKKNISVKGTTGDVSVKVSSTNKGDDVKIDVKNADMNAHIKNNNGKLNVNAHTKADVNVHVDRNEDIAISSKNSKLTDVKMSLGEKIAVDAKGKNFNVNIKGDDIGIKLKDAEFKGKVTPNPRIIVNTETQTKSELSVKIADKKEWTDINVSNKSALKGDVSIKDKIKSDFNNKNGFNLYVKDSDAGSIIKTNVDGLNLKGNVDAGTAKIDMDGQGNFNLTIDDTKEESDVNIKYSGKIVGNADVRGTAKGNYDVNGNVGVNIYGDDVKIDAEGDINARAKSEKLGIGANVKVYGDKNNKINVNINSKSDNKVDVKVANEGFVEITDIDQLKIGKSDKTVNDILSKLKSKSTRIVYQNLDIKENGQKVSVSVQAKDIKTEYGNISTAMSLRKSGERVMIDRGIAVVEPNEALFKFITDEVSKKYNIKVTGTPEFKDGVISIKGEVKTKTGITQIADFSIKTTVVNDNIVLDIDKANVLQVLGQNSVNKILNKVLNKTDIEHIKIDKNSITIKLADLFKDLSMTDGVNFTGVKLEDNKIKVGFTYNSNDQDIARLASKNDIVGIDKYLKENSLSSLSGEAISTAYSAYASSGDIDRTSKMISDISKSYADPTQGNKKEIARSLVWISKNQDVKKKRIEDDITLKFTKQIDLKSTEGQNIIKALPTEVVKNLANNLDKTISQGGGFSLITSDERENANIMRRLKGIPENKAML